MATITSATIVMARPQSLSNMVRGVPSGVQFLPTNVTGADKNAFPPVPSNLDGSAKAFLERYQPLSDKALYKVQPVNEVSFSAAGFCFSDFPCLSVSNAAVATIGDKEEIKREQISAILDQLTSSSQATFGNVPGNAFSGLKITNQGAVLDVIALPGSIESKVLAGMVFDMFKLQSDNVATNSIRATQAKTDGKDRSLLALCLYPEGADSQQAYNFCVGNELDGSSTPNSEPLPGQPSNSKRGLGITDLICSFVDLPLLC